MALTYLSLQDAVLGRRFPAASQRANAKRWLETAYTDVWNALRANGGLWTFELVSLSDLTVTGGDPTPTMPADYGDTLDLFDADGCKLERLGREDFEAYAVLPQGVSTTPYVYAVIDRKVHLAPTPAAMTLKHSYRRRVSHLDSDGTTVAAGFMDEDDDFPLWTDHHGLLIPRAYAIGLQELNDPTWEAPQAEYERQLSRMKDDLEYRRPQRQWGRTRWD